ncbi:hypothetical protein FA95DRAFT_1495126 [Auriscalpium vulgare]|uniref:Uncharacterized protein n=1 Tax=Auriscalpium vulgare TaxID=40419 RepID=A0ACB8RNC4_9AGAM|nr:hypothetical protein FA95DRAFT_1495126 [Auriscalpium vulgare]
MTDSVEFQESNSICFEWTVKGLKTLFESSKGETKSKVTKSVKFGGGRWQVLFYANSGTTSGAVTDTSGYISLFLSCEPTAEEKENALNGRWVRDGLFRFTFELHSQTKKDLFGVKEAHNHSFSYKTANWGWAQFARRDAVYYSRNIVKTHDTFVITCTISSMPLPPQPPPVIPRMPVPKDLLDSVGMLLDDPLYSDVEFVLPARGTRRKPRSIFAAKKLLSRADYFDSMFNSGFAEASSDKSISVVADAASEAGDAASELTALGVRSDDSDEEDEDQFDEGDAEADPPHFDFEREDEDAAPRPSASPVPPPGSPSRDVPEPAAANASSAMEGAEEVERMVTDEDEHTNGEARNVRPKLSHPSSPRSAGAQSTRYEQGSIPSGPPKQRVVVRDVAYATYRAVLYYLYTDAIWFAPLSSSFLAAPAPPAHAMMHTPNDSQANLGAVMRSAPTQGEAYAAAAASSRREWIRDWARNNSGRPLPCSAKAVYRLADKLDLSELKERAFQHIVKSLTVENVPYEVFSTFSATFEVVRKVEVKFFLDHWAEIRGSDAMRNVWHQIRLGRHPGFEEVWPVIATNLEFKAQTTNMATGSDKEEATKAI